MSHLFWLDDQAWSLIEPHLPKNQPGARRVDDRRVISGIIHVLKTGCRWIDCPVEYGPHTTIYNRFNRWSRRRLWTGILEALVEAPGRNGWENGTIGSFLERASACGMAHLRTAASNRQPDNPWRRAAEIVYCGKIYE